MVASPTTERQLITVRQILDAEHGSIFARGLTPIYGKKWIAVRGAVDDWAVYAGPLSADDEWIRHQGEKVFPIQFESFCISTSGAAVAIYRR